MASETGRPGSRWKSATYREQSPNNVAL
jgi:hypothetical protein